MKLYFPAKRHLVNVILILTWLASICFVMYGYFFPTFVRFGDSLSPAQEQVVLGEIRSIASPKGEWVAYHVVSSHCPCAVRARRYIEELKDQYPNVTHIVLDIVEKPFHPIIEFVPATPALILVSDKFEVTSYLGPHSSGEYCGQGISFLGTIVKNLQFGVNPKFYNSEAYGCFCKLNTTAFDEHHPVSNLD